MIESILPNLFLGIAANRIDRHVVQATLERVRGDLTIDKALRAAWQSAADELFGSFRATQGYVQLPATERALVNARLAWIKEDKTFEQVFRIQNENYSTFLLQDPAAVFLADDERARNDLFATLERLGIVDGLPGGLTSILQRGFIAQLRVQIIKAVILENESVRETAIFQQFVALRRTLGDSTQQSEQAWQDARARFEAYAQDQSIALSTIAQQLDRIVTHMGIGGPLPPIPRIHGFEALTAGLSVLPGAILTKIERFLVEYLGLPGSPVPFGGRTEEFATLDRWLTDRSKPYALLVAPTGRGKSALVSRWAHAVAVEGRAKVAFLPVSTRFDTARPEVAFGLLGVRLRHILSSADGASYPDASYWLREIDAYLRDGRPQDQPLLVVIDGADEADGWSLGRDLVIPPAAAPGLKVLVSARPLPDDAEGSWPNRLDWKAIDVQRLELPALSRAAVRQMLLENGHSGLAPSEVAPFVGEVYRLSSGDPIIVKLYIRLLLDRANAGSPLTPAELQSVEPGLSGYFQREWDGIVQQWGKDDPRQESVAHALLNVFSCARGPLTKHDLLALTKPEEGSSLRIERALVSLRRLVIGNANSGYFFSHPRFGQFVREELLTAEEVREWEARITDYGRGIVACLNTGDLIPTSLPRYVLEHHASHLASAGGAPTELFALISKPWLQAWEEYSGTYDGFLGDLYRAWRTAEALGSAAIAQIPPRSVDFDYAVKMQIRASLLASSIRSLAGSISFDLLRQLVEIGRWTPLQGIAYAAAMPTDPLRKAALCELASLNVVLPSRQAIEAVRGIGDKRTRVEALACVLPRLEDDWADQAAREALSLIQEITNVAEREAAIEALIPVLPELLLQPAAELGASIPSGYDRIKFLAVLATRRRGRAKVRLVSEALAEAAECDDGMKALALQTLAPVLTPTTIPIALALTEEVEEPHDRARALFALLPLLTGKTRRDAITTIDQAIESLEPDDRIDLRIALLDWVDDSDFRGLLDRLDLDAQEAATPGPQLRADSVFARVLVFNYRADDALAFVDEAFDHPASRAGVLQEMAGVAREDDRPRIVEACRTSIEDIDDLGTRVRAFVDLATVAPEPMKPGLVVSAIAAARAETAGRSRAQLLATVAQILPSDERASVLDEALTCARSAGGEWHLHSAVVLCEILKAADPAERPIVLGLVMGVLSRINRLVDRAYVLSLLLPYAYDASDQARLAAAALEALLATTTEMPVLASGNPIRNALDRSEWERYRADALQALVPHFDDRLLGDALDFARGVEYPSVEVEMLVAIARHIRPDLRPAVLEEAHARLPRVESELTRAHLCGLLYGETGPDGRDALVATIAALPDPMARAIGYTTALEHASDGQRFELVALAEEATSAIQRPQDRYRRFLHLASLVPEEDRAPLYRNAAAEAEAIPGEWERMVRLGKIAIHLLGEERIACLEAAKDAARALQPINGRWRAFVFLVCRLMDMDLADLAIALIPEIMNESARSEANVCVSARSGERFEVEAAIQTAEAIDGLNTRAELLVTVAEHAPPTGRMICLEKALAATLAIPRDRDRHPLLSLIMPLLAELSDFDRYTIWSKMLRTMGTGDRGRLLADLRTTLSAFVHVGGQSITAALAEAIAESDVLFTANP